MRHRSMSRLASGRALHAALTVAGVLCCWATPPVSADETAPQSPRLHVKPLADGGGLMPVSADQEPLNLRLTQGLKVNLNKAAQGSVTLAPATVEGGFTLEGTLSRVDNNAYGGSYILETRLFREEDPRLLLAYWSGMADNLRYLTDNLPYVKGAPTGGLVGELSRRVVAQTTRKPTPPITPEEFLKWADGLPRAPIGLVQQGKTGPLSREGEAIFQVAPESDYQFSVASGAADAHLFRLAEDGSILQIGIPIFGDAQQLVPEMPMKAGNGPRKVQFLILQRRQPASTVPVARNGEARSNSIEAGPVRLLEVISPVVSAVPTSRQVASGVADRIMARATREPAGVWFARRVTVEVEPSVTASPVTTPPTTKGTSSNAVSPRNYWELINAAPVAPELLKITMSPDRKELRVGDEINFQVHSQKPGYLVVLEVGTSGRVRVWSPEALPLRAEANPAAPVLDLSTLAIKPGQPHPLPMPEDGEEYSFLLDGSGEGSVCALVFENVEDALRLLKTFPGWSDKGAFVAGEGILLQDRKAWEEKLEQLPYAGPPVLAADFAMQVKPREGDRATNPSTIGLLKRTKPSTQR